MPEQLSPNTWRRQLRISVRSLIIIVLVFGAGLGWIVRSARVQRDAVAAIEVTGRHMNYEYDWEYIDGDVTHYGRPWAPKWLVDLLGVDFFGSIVRVDLGDQASHTVMTHIGRLERLEELFLSATRQVTDSWLIHLKGLRNLKELCLENTPITDAGLAHLDGLTGLERLNLSLTKVTDAGLFHLDGLTSLKELDLVGTRVGDAGLVHLKSLKNLETLDLRGTRVTESGVEEIRRAHPQLTVEHP